MDSLFPLKDRHIIAEGTMEFVLDTTRTEFTFRAGQHADFSLINPPHEDAEGSTRTFSLITSPNEKGIIAFATRMRDTAFKNSLKEIPLGTKIKVTGPFGSFTLHEDVSKPAVFLSGGIGITPIRSILAYAAEERLPHKLFLFYSNRNPASTAFLSDLKQFAEVNPNLTLVPTITDEVDDPQWQYEHGIITADMIKKYGVDLTQAIYYLSGPPPMVAAMRKLLQEAQVSGDAIKTEEFAGY